MAISKLYPAPDQTKLHEFVVDKIIDKQKEFPSQEGMKKKYIVEFTNGYAAEYCPLKNNPWDDRMKPGEKLLFRIIHRKDFGDEITPYTVTLPPMSTSISNPDSLAGRTVSMHGHPASIALNVAGHIYAAKIKAGFKDDDKDPDNVYGISNMQEDADIIYNWLVDKANNP